MNCSKALEHPVFEILVETCLDTGIKAYVVGGFVRDYLLGIPNQDIDIVVEGSGIEFSSMFAAKTGGKHSYYENYGTAMVRYDGLEIEFVGARKEMYERGSRNPIVEDGTLEDDLTRRDFTINAMAISLNEDFGELIDLFNGLEDLKNGILRTPLYPDITFSDDPLRMFRAARFIAKLKATGRAFIIEENTYNAIKNNRQRCYILTQERITAEIDKMFHYSTSSDGLQIMYETGLWEEAFPRLLWTGGASKIELVEILEKLENRDNANYNNLKWMAILGDKRFTSENRIVFVQDMRLPNIMAKYINTLHELRYAFIKDDLESVKEAMSIANFKLEDRYAVDDLLVFSEALEILYCNIYAKDKYDIKEKYALLKELVESLSPKYIKFECPLNGNEICEILGIKPGKEIGVIKNEIMSLILKGELEYSKECAKYYLFKRRYEN